MEYPNLPERKLIDIPANSRASWGMAWRQYQEYGMSIDLPDEDIRDPANIEDAFAVFTLGVICTGGQPSVRPSMKMCYMLFTTF